MKNLNSLLARLGTLSLAAALVFSVANAATARKDKVAAAVIEALVQQAAIGSEDASRATRSQAFSENVVIGTAAAGNTLTVHGNTRVSGDINAGRIGTSSADTGNQYIIGSQALEPRTQQLKIRFKDKTKAAKGAWVDLDFITTATSYRLGIADLGIATVAVRSHGIYAHPQMSVGAIQGVNGVSAKSLKGSTTVRLYNAPSRINPANDFALTPTVRLEAITRDVAFGFVPYATEQYPPTEGDGSGFYESGWTSSSLNPTRPVWDTGTVSYKIVSSNLAGYGVITSVSDSLQTVDVFDLFSDADLQTLLTALNSYFGNDSTKVREYLEMHGARLSRAFNELKA